MVYVNDRTNAVVYTGYDSRKSPFPHRGVFVHSKIADGWTDGSDFDFVRVATDVDRAIAGLPPITPDHPQGGQGAAGDQRVAAGLDAPAFDETSERETAVDIAKDRGLDVAEEVGFVAGWLARARIAAKGGAS